MKKNKNQIIRDQKNAFLKSGILRVLGVLAISFLCIPLVNAQTTQSFNFTGGLQTWVVPIGVTQVTIDCYGAQGIGIAFAPGNGGHAQGVLAVSPGQTLNINVGGSNGFNGGGVGQGGAHGGGASDVRVGGNTLADRVIVAGGGGGAGGDNWICNIGTGDGGGGTAVGTNFVGGAGGAGYTSGTGCGANGGNSGGVGGTGFHGGGGGGAGLVSGGGGAMSNGGTAQTGSLGQGGNSYDSPSCGATGGGGGGYYGGGGAAGTNCGAGRGGGGSSWTGNLTSPVFNAGVQTGDGLVEITYGSGGGGGGATTCITIPEADINFTSPACGTAGPYNCSSALTLNWNDANAGPITNATIEFEVGVNCVPGIYDVSLNGVVQGSINPDALCNCNEAPENFSINFNPVDYNVGGLNTVSIEYSGSCFGLFPAFSGDFAEVCVTSGMGSPCPPPVTYSFTGASQSYVVPAGVTMINIETWGAEGSGADDRLPTNGPGGLGGYATGDLAVTPGQVLNIYVGGAGSATGFGGFNGGADGGFGSPGSSCVGGRAGAGGGASDVRVGGTGLANRVIVGGGGGGGGADYCNGSCQPCGCGGTAGGAGGLTGVDGTAAFDCGFGFAGMGVNFGGGATQVSGGAGGPSDGGGGNVGTGGSLGAGGVGSDGTQDVAGGGGGGGYYGGGGGGGASNGSGVGAGGAGGGSSYIGGVANGATTSGVQIGDGLVVITCIGGGAPTALIEYRPDLSDPCSCNNDQTANGAQDGTFDETVVLNGTCGEMLFASATSTPAGLAGMQFVSGLPDPTTGECEYSLTFTHVDDEGYVLEVVDAMGNPVTGSGSGVPIVISNVCQYPEIVEPALGPFCADEGATANLDGLSSEVDANPGTMTTLVNGIPNNTFDPAVLGPGVHTVTWDFAGTFVDNSGGTLADPAYPGCETSYTADVIVNELPTLSVSVCMCGYDPNINNFGSLINYTVNGGDGPYTVTTTFGTLENSSPLEGGVYNLYLGMAGGAYTITVTDANGCSSSLSGSCDEGCFFEPAVITDPCSCNNDQSYNGAEDGTFKDFVEIVGPAGLNLIVGAGSTGMSVPVGTPIPQVAPGPPGVYRIFFDHVDLVGYTLFVEGVGPNGTFPILDAAGNQLTTTNACMYPVITEPEVDMVDFCFNGTPLVFTGDEVVEINGFSGNVLVYVGSQTFGDLVSEFDPTQYPPGVYILTFVFTGDFVSNTGTPGNPGFPGCQTSTSIQVGIGGGGALSCNDNVNITVNNDCELDFSWYTLLEADAIPNVFDAVFTDSAGNVISEDALGSYVGSSLTYSIEDMCNGNSCWGTINIDDKSIPEVACDCPVGGEDGQGTPDSYSEDCTLTCYEFPLLKEGYWDNLRDDLVPEDVGDFIDDNVTSVCDDVTEADVSYYDVYEDLGCEGSLMRRTWTVSYDKGFGVAGTVSCTREYFFQPLLLETVDTARIDPITGLVVVSEDSLRLPFHLVELDCGADISPAGIAAYFDNPASVDQDTDDDNIDPDELDIDCVIENNEGIVYAYPHFYIQGRNPAGPHAQAINTEICNLIVAYTDQEIEACAPGCAGNRKVLREWTILDWCASEFIQYQQIIKSVDQGAPIIEVSDVSVSVDPWKCSADVLLPHPEHLRDGCDGDLTYWIGSVEGGLTVTGNATDGYVLHDALEGVSWTVEYVTEDCCGNRASANIEVTVVDLTPPVPVTKEFIVISLVNIGNPEDEEQGIAKLFAVDVDNGSYDGCTGVTVEIRRAEAHCEEFDADTDWKDHVKFCCGDLEGQAFVEIDVEFRVTDEHGNVNYAWSTVRLEDKSSPTQICPPDLVLTCDMDYNDFTMTGLPQMFSACGEIDLMCDPNDLIEDTEPRRKGPNDGFFNNPLYDGVEVAAYDPSCGFGAVRRQFRSCSSCVQWFVIEPIDAFDATTIVWPSDQTVDCDDFDTGEPSWEESVCNLVGVTLASDTFLFEDGACFKILNHWSIINWCLYDASNPNGEGRYNHTQVIKIIDTQDPVMTVEDSLCFAVDIDCLSKGVQLSGSAVDEGDCGSDWLKWEVTIDLYSDWDLDYYYATALPRLVNGEPNPYHIAPTGNGELATVTLPDGIESTKQWHRAVWRSYDGCGNNISTVRYFQITDKKAPTPYCLNLSTAVMSGSGTVELWAIDFNVGSWDNCTENDNLIFTFTDVAPPPRDDSQYDSSSDLMWYNGTVWYYNSETGEYEDQDDYGDEVHRFEPGLRSAGKIFTVDDADASGFAQIPIYVWDECGNKDFCLVNLRLIDNMGVGEGRIAGQIVTEYGEEVEGVMTELMSTSPEYPVYNMTNNTGQYAFYNIPFNADYEVNGTRKDDYLNGVSTLDLLLIQKHILGNESLDSPYKMIAADANNDKNISAIDLIELRKLILGIYAELPENASWKVVDAEQALTVVNPWIYRENLNINDLNTNMEEEDFIGVKIGDVNNSVQANVRSGETEERNSGIELTYNDTYVKEGELVEIQMSGNTNENIYGYQFTMSTGGLELLEVRGENLDNSNVAVFEGSMTMSYNDVNPISSDALFTLVFKATQEGRISDIINVNSTITQAEAYVGENLKVVEIDLRGSEDRAIEFALYQNQPNPFSEYTMIGFDVPNSGKVSLSLYDVTGKVLKVFNTEATQGYNEVRVNKSDLEISGLIYYKLQANENIATRHMMMIE